MDVVQWVIPGGLDGGPRSAVGACFAPAWADRLPPSGRRPALRRRSAPLVSRHLSRPLAVAVPAGVEDDEAQTSLSDAPGHVTLRLSLAVEGEPLLPAHADDVHFASVFGEFIGVAIDLCEAAGLPVMGACPADERRALDIVLGSLRGQGRSRLADALLLLRAGAQQAALARGFSLTAELLADGRSIGVDGELEAAL